MVATTPCTHCGGGKQTGRCPKCSTNLPRSVGLGGAVVIAFLLYQCSSDTREVATAPEPRAATVQELKDEEYGKASALKKEMAFRKVVMILTELKKAQRDPDSLVWEDISATSDASVMCIKYRSRNGFGGMNKNILVVAKKKASDKSAAWNNHCAGPGRQLEQFDYAANAL